MIGHDRLRLDQDLGKPQKKMFFFIVDKGGRGCQCPLRKKEPFCWFFFICSRLKIKYILFKTSYPNIIISVLVYCVVGRQTHSI